MKLAVIPVTRKKVLKKLVIISFTNKKLAIILVTKKTSCYTKLTVISVTNQKLVIISVTKKKIVIIRNESLFRSHKKNYPLYETSCYFIYQKKLIMISVTKTN